MKIRTVERTLEGMLEWLKKSRKAEVGVQEMPIQVKEKCSLWQEKNRRMIFER